MGAVGITIIVVVGLIIGLGAQVLTKPQNKLDWLFVAVTTAIGGFIGSEWLTQNGFGDLATGPTFDGLIIVPAILVGLTLGLLTDALVRYISFEPA